MINAKQNLIFLIEPSHIPWISSLKASKLLMNRFLIDETAAFETSGIYYLKETFGNFHCSYETFYCSCSCGNFRCGFFRHKLKSKRTIKDLESKKKRLIEPESLGKY